MLEALLGDEDADAVADVPAARLAGGPAEAPVAVGAIVGPPAPFLGRGRGGRGRCGRRQQELRNERTRDRISLGRARQNYKDAQAKWSATPSYAHLVASKVFSAAPDAVDLSSRRVTEDIFVEDQIVAVTVDHHHQEKKTWWFVGACRMWRRRLLAFPRF